MRLLLLLLLLLIGKLLRGHSAVLRLARDLCAAMDLRVVDVHA